MRILLTGMTNMQQQRIKKRVYNTSISAFHQALVAAKHSVDWRRLEWNESNLNKKYDLCIIGLGTISEFSCTALYETLLATQADNVLYLINDWKANATIKLLMTGDLFRDFVLRNNTGKNVSPEKVREKKMQEKIERCRNRMFRFGNNLVGPFFSWGNRVIITEGTPFDSIHEYNPSPWYLPVGWSRDGDATIPAMKSNRKKQWIYGALADYSKWHQRLDTTWPIVAFTKKTFIPEIELKEKYRESYGMLMPKYKASGSGWWRARYCHAVHCQNVMYAEEKEVEGTGLYKPIHEIEAMSTQRLKAFIRFQREEFLKQTPSFAETIDIVNNIVQEAAK